jgi:hypothetical protein
MKIYNLTDVHHPRDRSPISPQVLKINGKEIKPGEYTEFKKINLADISGLVKKNSVCIDIVPDWYTSEKNKRLSPETVIIAEG